MRVGIKCRGLLEGQAFTLVEMVVVLLIIAAVFSVLAVPYTGVSFWREDAAVRKLVSLIEFLHTQAMIDRTTYVIQFDINSTPSGYRVGELYSTGNSLVGSSEHALSKASIDPAATSLTAELNRFLLPSTADISKLAAPQYYPSLAEPVEFPSGITFDDIRTLRGQQYPGEKDRPYILFSPLGFSEFAVLHLRLSNHQPLTILVNSFTGLTETFHEYKDFEWTYGKEQDGQES